MRSRQVTQYEGELLGDIDWSYNFAPHFDCYCVSDERKAEMIYDNVERLYQVERLHKKGFRLRITKGDYWHELIAVGMYDGWPYWWKPTPAIMVRGPLGGQWELFPCVDAYKIL
jgi:hypothetical protein